MLLRNPQYYSKIGLEVGEPHHGFKGKGKVDGVDSSLHGGKFYLRAQGGHPDPDPGKYRIRIWIH